MSCPFVTASNNLYRFQLLRQWTRMKLDSIYNKCNHIQRQQFSAVKKMAFCIFQCQQMEYSKTSATVVGWRKVDKELKKDLHQKAIFQLNTKLNKRRYFVLPFDAIKKKNISIHFKNSTNWSTNSQCSFQLFFLYSWGTVSPTPPLTI